MIRQNLYFSKAMKIHFVREETRLERKQMKNSYFIKIFIFFSFLSFGCNCKTSKPCSKQILDGKSFYFFWKGGYSKTNYVSFKDSVQYEYIGNQLVLKQKVKWTSCDRFTLIVEEMYGDLGYDLGDSVTSKILRVSKDTVFIYVQSSYFEHAGELIEIK